MHCIFIIDKSNWGFNFFQFLITFIIFINIKNVNLVNFIKLFYKKIFYFIFLLLLFIFILNPVYWTEPTAFFYAIKWMSHYYHDICTTTLGSCLSAKDLPPTYLLIWLSVKLPLMIILILLIPFSEKYINREQKNFSVWIYSWNINIYSPFINSNECKPLR